MTKDSQLHEIRNNWIGRQRELGNQPRAVLMKGLHPLINQTIDLWHRAVMRVAFAGYAEQTSDVPSLDIGCGYGRLAGEAIECGLAPVVGIDFAPQFCADFQRHHGSAVCGELSRLPFASSAFRSAYSVTALMYLSVDDARLALEELDRCLMPGSRILVLEPCREFNTLIRIVLRQKRNEALSRPGFSLTEMRDTLPPRDWQRVGAGSCAWMTAFLPVLLVAARFSSLYAMLSKLVLRLDRPKQATTSRGGKFSMYRWAVYQKA